MAHILILNGSPRKNVSTASLIKKAAVQKSVILFLILCITLVSVNWVKATSSEDIFGTVNGDVYENTLIGYGCNLPGWYYYTEDDIAALYQLNKETYSQEIVDMIEASANITVMFAEDRQGKNNINIQLQYAKQNIPVYTLMGMDWLIDNMLNSLAEMYNSAGFMVTDSEKIRITMGEEQHLGIKTSAIKDNEKVFFEEISFIRGDYMVYITATSFGEDTTSNSLSHFYALNSSPGAEETRVCF